MSSLQFNWDNIVAKIKQKTSFAKFVEKEFN